MKKFEYTKYLFVVFQYDETEKENKIENLT